MGVAEGPVLVKRIAGSVGGVPSVFAIGELPELGAHKERVECSRVEVRHGTTPVRQVNVELAVVVACHVNC